MSDSVWFIDPITNEIKNIYVKDNLNVSILDFYNFIKENNLL